MNKNKLLLELLWWIFTAIFTTMVLYPIWSKVTVYPERINYYNLAYIITFITLTRYIFLIKYTFLANSQVAKAIMIVVVIPIIIFSIDGVFSFRQILDNDGYAAICQGVPDNQINSIGMYYRNEYLFFGVSAIITAIIFPFRMVVSIWRKINRGTV
jgi:hypothetical protein